MRSLTPPTDPTFTVLVYFTLLPGGASERRRSDLLALVRDFAGEFNGEMWSIPTQNRGLCYEIACKAAGNDDADAQRTVVKVVDAYITRMFEGAEDDEEWALDFVP